MNKASQCLLIWTPVYLKRHWDFFMYSCRLHLIPRMVVYEGENN